MVREILTVAGGERLEPTNVQPDTIKGLSLLHPGPRPEYPEEARNRYPRRGVYRHIDYLNITFNSDGHAMFMYGVYADTGNDLPRGNKLVVRPVGWLYE